MRGHGFKLVRKNDIYPLALLFILLFPVIIAFKIIEELWFAAVYVIGFMFMMLDGKGLREAHEDIMADIQSMRDGAKYGGM